MNGFINFQNRRIVVEYVNQLVQATFTMGAISPVVLVSSRQLVLRKWHHLLVEIRTSSHSLGYVHVLIYNAMQVHGMHIELKHIKFHNNYS